MTDTITLTGLVATIPRHLVTSEGLPITSFRLASSQRRFDRAQNRWIDADTNWYTVTAFRQLALNISGSIEKGERVIVTGRLRMREWTAGERAGTNIEIDADSIGHDLSWGTARFTRSISTTVIDSATIVDPGETPGATSGGATAETDDAPDEFAQQQPVELLPAEQAIPVPF